MEAQAGSHEDRGTDEGVKNACGLFQQAAGVRAYPLLYEEFVLDKVAYFERLLRQLEIKIPRSEVEATLGMGSHFKKVHSSEISEFVENHEEITERFGHRYVKWEEPA